MQLKCEQCGAPFQAKDLHLERGLATCSACGAVQQLPQRLSPESHADQALFVEQRLERFLNIEDRLVPGELSS